MSGRIVFQVVMMAGLCATGYCASTESIAATTNNAGMNALKEERWKTFEEDIQNANREFAKGEMNGTRNIWSHGNDVTVFGGYGALVEPGWRNVDARLSWAAKQYTDGKYSCKKIKSVISGDFAYLLQTERWSYPGKPVMDLRVTMICRWESDGWKIVHRHGDMITPIKKKK